MTGTTPFSLTHPCTCPHHLACTASRPRCGCIPAKCAECHPPGSGNSCGPPASPCHRFCSHRRRAEKVVVVAADQVQAGGVEHAGGGAAGTGRMSCWTRCPTSVLPNLAVLPMARSSSLFGMASDVDVDDVHSAAAQQFESLAVVRSWRTVLNIMKPALLLCKLNTTYLLMFRELINNHTVDWYSLNYHHLIKNACIE
jgi:hypothetical protein